MCTYKYNVRVCVCLRACVRPCVRVYVCVAELDQILDPHEGPERVPRRGVRPWSEEDPKVTTLHMKSYYYTPWLKEAESVHSSQ